MTRTTLKTALPFALALTLAAGSVSAMTTAGAYKSDTPPATTVESTSIETFYEMIDAAGLETSLTAGDPITIFAPTDAAFNDLSADEWAMLLDPKNKDKLTRFVHGHMILGLNNPKRKGDPLLVESLGDTRLAINLDDGFTVNGTRVIDRAIMTKYGLVHVIEKPLVPLL